MTGRDNATAAAGSTNVPRWRDGQPLIAETDCVAVEEPLEIRVNGRAVAVTMRTPGNDFELAAGFLRSEGMVRSGDDIVSIMHCQDTGAGNVLNVLLDASAPVDFTRLTRHVFASSSCGVCGKASIEAVHQNFPRLDTQMAVDAAVVRSLPERMRAEQNTFARTGGVHAAAIFDTAGTLVALREDVGRHNAVDKVVGWALLRNLSLEKHVLLVSGRASFEMVQKALSARIPFVCAISAASSLAIAFAKESGQTLIGFLREGGMNIYSRAERITSRS